jgi:hypothetical protein
MKTIMKNLSKWELDALCKSLKGVDGLDYQDIVSRTYAKLAFKREKRSIQYLHRLWCDTKKRQDERRSLIQPAIKKILEQVKPNKKGEYKFYHRAKDNTLYEYIIYYSKQYETHVYSYQKFDTRSRDGKITMLTADSTIGDEFNFIVCDMQSNLQSRVFGAMWDKIREFLDENIVAEKHSIIDRIVKLDIDDVTYLVGCNNEYQSTQMKYNWLGADIGERFILS